MSLRVLIIQLRCCKLLLGLLTAENSELTAFGLVDGTTTGRLIDDVDSVALGEEV